MAASSEAVEAALVQFERLHQGRWQHRGGSAALSEPVSRMLRGAADQLGPARFQIWTAEVDQAGAVASAVFLTAGAEMHYWLGGFDERWSRWSPSLLLLVEAVQYAADCGCHRMSLGPGAQAYKYRIATGEDLLDSVDLMPRGTRYPYVRARQSTGRLYRLASSNVPPLAKQRLRSATGSVRRARSVDP